VEKALEALTLNNDSDLGAASSAAGTSVQNQPGGGRDVDVAQQNTPPALYDHPIGPRQGIFFKFIGFAHNYKLCE
jgi:hypothetical protein